MGLRQVFLQGNVGKFILLSLSSVNEKLEAKVSVFFGSEKRGFFYNKKSFEAKLCKKVVFFKAKTKYSKQKWTVFVRFEAKKTFFLRFASTLLKRSEKLKAKRSEKKRKHRTDFLK
jgi:hypothetical protein